MSVPRSLQKGGTTMALEDRFLKKNIPGKYSWWDEQDSDDAAREETDSDDSSEADEAVASRGGTREPVAINTPTGSGFKGRLRAHRQTQAEKSRQRQAERLEEREIVKRQTEGATLRPGELSISASAVQDRNRSEKATNHCSDSSSEASDDDDFLEQYRRNRLLELQKTNAWPTFGFVEDVDPIQYAQAINETDPRVAVIVHLYEPSIPTCRTLHQHWQELASGMEYARFLSLDAYSASQTLDPICLPAVVIYKGGRLLHNLSPVTQHLPQPFSPSHVKQLLESCGVIDPHCTQSKTVSATKTVERRTRRIEPVFDSDDELDEFCKGFETSAL